MNTNSFLEPYNVVQRMFQPASAALEKTASRFWEQQAELLAEMQAFANDWFERRQAGTQAALEAAHRLCSAATPAEWLKSYQQWATGAFELMAADLQACQSALGKAAAAVGPSLVPSSHETSEERAPAEASEHAAA